MVENGVGAYRLLHAEQQVRRQGAKIFGMKVDAIFTDRKVKIKSPFEYSIVITNSKGDLETVRLGNYTHHIKSRDTKVPHEDNLNAAVRPWNDQADPLLPDLTGRTGVPLHP